MSFPSSADAASLPAPPALAIHLDLVGGISGDMFVAAMVDALPAFATPVLEALSAVRPAGAPEAAFQETSNGGLRARRFGVAASAGTSSYRVAGAERSGATAGVAGHAGTTYSMLREALERAPLSAPTRRHALALLALLAEAEAGVHGVDVAKVHFHEIGDWDSLMDVVAAGCRDLASPRPRGSLRSAPRRGPIALRRLWRGHSHAARIAERGARHGQPA